ncbi:hypothetical protein FGO68_gene1485 [Halteria grandinella]|uniref:Uncharacterized protein n=1 Tax=Halteria grandinella TaxID=5974 RepID=A0A8J8NJ62_HALGN|nr:hypothetical protein FGO68_gene1485 [Halteria grandinella]
MNTFIIINMSLSKALCLAGILLVSSVSADCFDSCNTTMDYCHNNPVVDQTVCTNGDSSCLTRCYNTAPEFQWGQPVYANNCSNLANYVEFANNQTSHDLMTRCMYRAFEAIATCTSIFEKACEPLRWFFSGSAFNAKEACADLKLC